MSRTQIFVFIFVLFVLVFGCNICHAQTPQPQIKIDITQFVPSFDWRAITGNLLSKIHPALLAAIGLGLSVWAISFGYKVFVVLSHRPETAEQKLQRSEEYARNRRFQEMLLNHDDEESYFSRESENSWQHELDLHDERVRYGLDAYEDFDMSGRPGIHGWSYSADIAPQVRDQYLDRDEDDEAEEKRQRKFIERYNNTHGYREYERERHKENRIANELRRVEEEAEHAEISYRASEAMRSEQITRNESRREEREAYWDDTFLNHGHRERNSFSDEDD